MLSEYDFLPKKREMEFGKYCLTIGLNLFLPQFLEKCGIARKPFKSSSVVVKSKNPAQSSSEVMSDSG